jgi:hypothetical protein
VVCSDNNRKIISANRRLVGRVFFGVQPEQPINRPHQMPLLTTRCFLWGPVTGYIRGPWSRLLVIGKVSAVHRSSVGLQRRFSEELGAQGKSNQSTQSRVKCQGSDSIVIQFQLSNKLLTIYASELNVHWRFHLPAGKHPLTRVRGSSTTEKISPVEHNNYRRETTRWRNSRKI